ncbi:MAG: glgB1, partial [Ilumatobacteraceae bacterium]|nr:glgB1 [Ilumatobacteraceae bacterium]
MSGKADLSGGDLYLYNEGTHRRVFDFLGAHVVDGGIRFAVWAPNARAVRVVGSFDGWTEHEMHAVASSGIWSTWCADANVGDHYRFKVQAHNGQWVDKSDPVASATCASPSSDCIIADLTYEWQDGEWMAARQQRIAMDAPISIYEVHLGSWGRTLSSDGRFPRYDELADPLADHALAHGFTHLELLPIMEHPFYGSWGYQTTGYFAPTARYGSPTDLMRMIDRLHQRGVGVILDWV